MESAQLSPVAYAMEQEQKAKDAHDLLRNQFGTYFTEHDVTAGRLEGYAQAMGVMVRKLDE